MNNNTFTEIYHNEDTHTKISELVIMGNTNNTEVKINNNLFKKYKNIKKIIIKNCDLKEINISDTRNFLTDLYLINLKIKIIKLQFLIGFNEFIFLLIKRNNIKTIKDNTFSDLKKLIFLNLVDNNITYISTAAFHGLNNLYTLNLSGNYINLAIIPFDNFIRLGEMMCNYCDLNIIRDVTFLCKVKYIILDNNKITTLSNNPFTNCYNITHLSFSKNIITFLNADSFYNITKLKMLDIGHNKITSIGPNTFKSNTKLLKLYLSDNLLLNININIFTSLNSILYLYIDNNPLHCDCSMQWIMNKSSIIKYLSNKQKLTCDDNNYNLISKLESMNCNANC